MELLRQGKAVPVCPEQLGGQATPRPPHEIINGDVTAEFLKGAYETLKIAKEMDINIAILKARSPSCGKGRIYDGTFSGAKKDGNGVTAELLMRNNIKVYSEEELDKFFEENQI